VPRVRRLTIAALLASALAVGSCGGDGGKADEQADRLSAPAYRAQLTRLCAESEQEAARIGGVQGANAGALAEYFDKIASVQTTRRMQFERLRPPPDLQDEHAQIAPLLEQEIAAVKRAATSFRAGSDPLSTYKTFKTRENRVLRRQAKLLKRLKVAGCHSDTGPTGSAAQGPS